MFQGLINRVRINTFTKIKIPSVGFILFLRVVYAVVGNFHRNKGMTIRQIFVQYFLNDRPVLRNAKETSDRFLRLIGQQKNENHIEDFFTDVYV